MSTPIEDVSIVSSPVVTWIYYSNKVQYLIFIEKEIHSQKIFLDKPSKRKYNDPVPCRIRCPLNKDVISHALKFFSQLKVKST